MTAEPDIRCSRIKTYKDLSIWKQAMTLVKRVYEVTAGFPSHELYGLMTQMRRSAVSIPSNVAEGFNRYHNAEYRQALRISLGSCAELETQVMIARQLSYISSDDEAALLEMLDHIGRMINNLIKKLN